MVDFMKAPCPNCPFRRDVKPYLTAERGADLAYSASNPYNSFECHLTIEHYSDGPFEGEGYAVETSKQCAGFLSVMHNELDRTPYDEDGFEPSPLAYDSYHDMIDAYEDQGR